MNYLLLVYSPESAWTQDEWTACTVESAGICRELAAKGQFRDASPLHPVATATTVRIRKGQTQVTTGPFAETAEQLGGYFLIDVQDLDEAIAVAARLPAAKKGTIEIRPLHELAGKPADQMSAQPSDSAKPYLFLCYDDEAAWNEAGPGAMESAMAEAVQLAHQMAARGRYRTASPLRPTSTATCVRLRKGQRLITDGPYTETREALGGYYLIWADNQDEAVRWAMQHPGARLGAVEVRPVYVLEGLPESPQGIAESQQSYSYETTVPAKVEAVYESLLHRIPAWWTTDLQGTADREGSTFRVAFGETYKVFRVKELAPSTRVVWECLESHLAVPELSNKSEWVGTLIHWALTPLDHQTLIHVTHEGLTPDVECYEICSQGWQQFIGGSLVPFLEQGQGHPYRAGGQ